MEKGRGNGVLVALVVVLVIVNILTLVGGVLLFRRFTGATTGNGQVVIKLPDTPTPGETQPTDSPDGTKAPTPTAIAVGDTATPTPAGQQTVGQQDPVAAKHVDNLALEILEAKLPEGATAVVSVIDGSEYLKLSIEGYNFYYRNDYVKYGSEPYGKVIIEKDDLKKEFAWDYSLKAENMANLIPVLFDWRDNKLLQMAFVFKKMEDGEEERTGAHFVTCSDLIEYTTLSPELGFLDCISIGGFVDNENETLVCIENDSRKYYISAGRKLTEQEKSGLSLSVLNDIKYSLLNERVFVSTKVELSGLGWIGEISARVTYTTFDIFGNHANVFYCYAEQAITAEDDMLIIKPVENYADTKQSKISLTGDDGEKMIFFAKEGITQSWQDPSLMKVNEDGYMEYKDDSVAVTWGVDVSKFNTVTSWKSVKAAGFSYAIIRMGYRGYGTSGALVVDPSFVSNIEGALNAGLDVGVYYFTQAVTVEEAVEEANTVIQAIKKYNVTYPVVFDTEYYNNVDARANNMSVQLRTDIIKAFCETVEAAGYKAMIYSSTNWSLLSYDRSQLDKYDFWYAYYGLNIDYPYHYEMLQYASDGQVPGIKGDVDINICFKNYKK